MNSSNAQREDFWRSAAGDAADAIWLSAATPKPAAAAERVMNSSKAQREDFWRSAADAAADAVWLSAATPKPAAAAAERSVSTCRALELALRGFARAPTKEEEEENVLAVFDFGPRR